MLGGRSVLAVVLASVAGAGCAQVVPTSDAAPRTAPVQSSDDTRFETLVRLVATRGVRSIEELLPLLPEDLRSRHILLYESRSMQGASYANPRVLLYTRNARFVVAYGGDPRRSGYGVLETMSFDDRGPAFRFREIAFSDEGGLESRATFSEPNPPRCLSCHGEDPRPVWDSYPTWPGAYGEQDHMRPSADEAAGFAAFFGNRASNPRYRVLGGLESPTAPLPGADVAAYEGKDVLSRNAEFGALLQGLGYRIIARQVTDSDRFQPFRYALLASLDPQCLDIDAFLPGAVKARFSRSERDFESETLRANLEQAASKRRRTHSQREPFASEPPETLTPFRYLVEEGLGLPTKDWTLALEKSTYDFASPRPSTRVLVSHLLDAVARTDPTLRASHDMADHRDGYCAILRKRSLAALDSR